MQHIARTVPRTGLAQARSYATSTSPSQWKGHLNWVQGTAASALGAITASSTLKNNGAAQRADGVRQMRQAKAHADKELAPRLREKSKGRLATEGVGEGIAGSVLGCPGMRERAKWKVEEANLKDVGQGPTGGSAV